VLKVIKFTSDYGISSIIFMSIIVDAHGEYIFSKSANLRRHLVRFP